MISVEIIGALAAVVIAGYAAFSAHAADRAAWNAYRHALNAEDEARRNHRLTSVNIAAQALKEFAADRDMQRVFYLIEYRGFEYHGIHSLRESVMERRTDKLLRHFAAVALAWKSGFVKEESLRVVRYYVLKILGDANIRKYMQNVCTNTEGNLPCIGEHPYHVLVEMGEVLRKSPPDEVHAVECWDFCPKYAEDKCRCHPPK